MLSELDLLLDVTRRLEDVGLEYMITGSMAPSHSNSPNPSSIQPRFPTRHPRKTR